MWTYHHDTFIQRYRLYRAGLFVAAFVRESDLLNMYPKAKKV